MSRLVQLGRLATRQFSTAKNTANKVLLRQPNKLETAKRGFGKYADEWVKPLSGLEVASIIGVFSVTLIGWGFWMTKEMIARREFFDTYTYNQISDEDFAEFKRKQLAEFGDGDDDDDEDEDEDDEDETENAQAEVEEVAFEEMNAQDKAIAKSEKDTVIFIDPPK